MRFQSVCNAHWQNIANPPNKRLYGVSRVVAYIDAHYRTLADRASRGLVGHSMGGYGATRIGMKHADVFGSLYIMSPCCLASRPAPTDVELQKKIEAAKSKEDLDKLT